MFKTIFWAQQNLKGKNFWGRCPEFPSVAAGLRLLIPHLDHVEVWSLIPDSRKSSATSIFKWQFKKHLLHEKDTNYVFTYHFTPRGT